MLHWAVYFPNSGLNTRLPTLFEILSSSQDSGVDANLEEKDMNKVEISLGGPFVFREEGTAIYLL